MACADVVYKLVTGQYVEWAFRWTVELGYNWLVLLWLLSDAGDWAAGAGVTDSSLVDDGIQRSGSRSSDNSRGGGLGFSTSVPIDVPAWMGSSMNQATFNYHDDDDVNRHMFVLS